MTLSDTTRCEYLCRRKRQDGCCYLGYDVAGSSVGCFWIKGVSPRSEENDTQIIAIACVQGKIQCYTFYLYEDKPENKQSTQDNIID